VAKEELAALSSAANYDTYTAGGLAAGGLVDAGVADRIGAALTVKTGDSTIQQDTSFGKRKVPLIIYASRTHSQLAQVVRELNATAFRPKISVIASRDQLCILPAMKGVGSNAAQNALCTQLVRKKACAYHGKVGETLGAFKNACNSATGPLMDIEEIVKFGQAHQACPFFLARDGNAEADMLFMPYNYLVDRKARSGLGLDLNGAVIIFDEAHNLEGSCGEASSFDLTTEDLRAGAVEAARVMKLIEDGSIIQQQAGQSSGAPGPAECAAVQAFLLSLLSQLTLLPLPPATTSDPTRQKSFRSDLVYDMVFKSGATVETIKKLLERFSSVAKAYIEDRHAASKKSNVVQGGEKISCRLQSVETVLRILFKPAEADENDASTDSDGSPSMVMAIGRRDAPAFRAHVVEETSSGSAVKRTLSLWCFNPGMALRDLAASAALRSIILASGTLSPMPAFAHELQLPFPYRLENAHVIDSDKQLLASVLRAGPRDVPLNASYGQRDSVLYKTELGLAIAGVAPRIPGGLLVFFPSYTVMAACMQHWKSTQHEGTTIWSLITRAKSPFVEPRDKHELAKVMAAYEKAVDGPGGSGAIFFAVCRGKVSEGLDFADARGRAVIITGIPFPPFKDPKVMLKRDYLSDIQSSALSNGGPSIGTTTLTGDEWYSQQASRAVNQAIGRVIRHRHDYGAILFFDDRFAQPRISSQLSRWIRPCIRPATSFRELQAELEKFFRGHREVKEREERMVGWREEMRGVEEAAAGHAVRLDSFSKARAFFKANPFMCNNGPCAEGTNTVSQVNPLPSALVAALAKKTFKGDGICSVARDNPSGDLPTSNPNDRLQIANPNADPISAEDQPQTDVQQARDYLTQVRTRLPSFAATHFTTLLKSYKVRKLDCPALIDALLLLLHEHNAMDLIGGFRPFVSARNQGIFEKKVVQFVAHNSVRDVQHVVENVKETVPLLVEKRVEKQATSIKRSAMQAFFAPVGSSVLPTPRPHILAPPASTMGKIEPITQRLLAKNNPPSLQPMTATAQQDPCPICRERPDKPFRAKCGHVCCFACWSSWLANTLECPICRLRTRLSQLAKIYQ